MTKGVPGDFIVFFDKHGNCIRSYRYDKYKRQISVFENGMKVVYTVPLATGLRDLDDFPLDMQNIV